MGFVVTLSINKQKTFFDVTLDASYISVIATLKMICVFVIQHDQEEDECYDFVPFHREETKNKNQN